jgi:hypothetical protein
MKTFKTLVGKILILLMLIVLQTFISNAQFREGAWGLSAGVAMPSGVTLSAGIPTSSLSNVTFTYSFSSSFVYALNQSLQLEAGVGYLTAGVSTDPLPNGQKNPDNQNLFSVNVGGKYFLMTHDVMPYLFAGFSYTSLPSTKTVYNEISGSLISALAGFGAQSFINTSKTIALFIQFGVGFNKGTVTTKMTEGSTSSTDVSNTNINFGGSAVGATIYF